MPYNGSGTFTRLHSWVTDRNAGTKIRADKMDGEDNGFATGLSNCITKDGQTTISGDIPFGGNKITGLGTPTATTDAATKAYADAVGAASQAARTVRAATTANITIATALNASDSLDGVTLAADDLVLVKNQTDASENGIYVVGSTPARDARFDTYDEHSGMVLSVQEGTTNANTIWLCTSATGGTLATTDIDWVSVEPLTTRGDIMIRDASSNVRLAVGSSGQFLTSDGTDPSWGALPTATNAEQVTGTATDKLVTPGTQKYSELHAKAILTYDQNTDTVEKSVGVTSVSDDSTGDFTVTWSDTYSDTNYITVGMGSAGSSPRILAQSTSGGADSPTARSFKMTNSGGTDNDDESYIALFGTLA